VCFSFIAFRATFTISNTTVLIIRYANTIQILIVTATLTSAAIGIATGTFSAIHSSACLAIQECFTFTAFFTSILAALAALFTKQLTALLHISSYNKVSIFRLRAAGIITFTATLAKHFAATHTLTIAIHGLILAT